MEMAPPQETREIAFHSQHARLGKCFVVFLFLDIAWAVLLIVLLFLAGACLFMWPNTGLLVIQIFMVVMMLFCSACALFLVICFSSFALSTVLRLISRRPVLLVTSEGIIFQNLLTTGNFFLSRNEIASFSLIVPATTSSRRVKELCLNPKDRTQFLSRYHPLWRFFVRAESLGTGSLINIPQWFLSTQVEEVLAQIQETFQEEFQTYEIQAPDKLGASFPPSLFQL